jgi:hypothetical protein
MNWYVGPWIWDKSRPCWSPPAGCHAIDIRPLWQQGTPGGNPGFGIFAGQVELSRDYLLLGSGSWHDVKPNRLLIPCRNKYKVRGDTLHDMLHDALLFGADPDGQEFNKPLMPTTDSVIELQCGFHSRRKFKLYGDQNTAIHDMLRQEFAATMEAAHAGETSDPELHRRKLDYWCIKHRTNDWKQFVPKKLLRHVEGPLEHHTTYTEDFTRANSSSQVGNLLTWAQQSGTWGTFSNAAYKVSSGSIKEGCRAQHDLSSADHSAQVTVSNGAQSQGPAARFDSAATTLYSTTEYGSTTYYLTKVVAQTETGIGNVGNTYADGDIYKVSCNGSTIKSYKNGVEVISVTDTSITGNVRCGMFSSNVNGLMDDFIATDLSAGGGGGKPTVYYSQMRS